MWRMAFYILTDIYCIFNSFKEAAYSFAIILVYWTTSNLSLKK